MNKNLNKQIENLLNDKYEYNSEEWGDVINDLLAIDKEIENPIFELERMSNSNSHTVIISLAFILENISLEFIKKHNKKIKSLVVNSIRKGNYRANIDFIQTYSRLLEIEDDYIFFLSRIKSGGKEESSIALTNLLYMNNSDYNIFNQVSDWDFKLFIDETILSKGQFERKTKEKSILYKKFILTALYKWKKDKGYLYNLTEQEYELFEFIYIYLD